MEKGQIIKIKDFRNSDISVKEVENIKMFTILKRKNMLTKDIYKEYPFLYALAIKVKGRKRYKLVTNFTLTSIEEKNGEILKLMKLIGKHKTKTMYGFLNLETGYFSGMKFIKPIRFWNNNAEVDEGYGEYLINENGETVKTIEELEIEKVKIRKANKLKVDRQMKRRQSQKPTFMEMYLDA